MNGPLDNTIGCVRRGARSPRRTRWSWVMVALLLLALTPLPASAGVVVDFVKFFQPAVIGPGSTTTLQFTIANIDPAVPVTDLAFSDTLPAGVQIAPVPDVRSSCKGQVTAPQGGVTIALTGGSLDADSHCVIRVNVYSTTIGTHMNVSGDLTSSAGNHGSAAADLEVTDSLPGFGKFFTDSDVILGERTTLIFIIDNTANPSAEEFLEFTDRLPDGLQIASPANASTDCGSASTITELIAEAGSRDISLLIIGSLSHPAVAAADNCYVQVDVVPQAVGVLGNVSGVLQTDLEAAGRASARLTVSAAPVALVKEFLDDPVAPGDDVILRFTLTNRSRTDTATGIAFTDDLDATLSGLAATGLPLSNVCGAGSSLSGAGLISLSGGQLAPGQSCTFDVSLSVPPAAPSGAYPNEASMVSSSLGGEVPATIPDYGARDILHVAPVPVFTKTFLGEPAAAGGMVELEFSITNTSASFEATDISFLDEFDVALPGAVVVPADGACGPGSTFAYQPLNAGSSGGQGNLALLLMSGGSLAAGASCTFSLQLTVSPMAGNGSYENRSSALTAVVDGATVTGAPAEDQFEIVGAPQLIKRFLDNPAASPGTATLEFSIANGNAGQPDQDVVDHFTNLAFSDNLDATLSGLVATGLPLNDVCGAGSTLSGSSTLNLTGGNVPAGGGCTFQVPLQVPGGAAPGSYGNTTSAVTATARGVAVTGPAASDTLEIAGLAMSKEFIDDPVLPGGTVTLRFTIQNLSADLDASNIAFADDLSNVMSGLVATGLPMSDVCGPGSSLTGFAGNTRIQLINGVLAAGGSCTFDVVLQVPAMAAVRSYWNTTGSLSGLMDGSTIEFGQARDLLVVGTDEPTTVTVNKAYAAGTAGPHPEVLITLSCPGGTIAENGGVNVATVGGVATFTVSGIPQEGMVCSATETVPDGYFQAASSCDAINVNPGADPGPSCTITNQGIRTRATFAVTKSFSDSVNPTPVNVTLDCNTGLPLTQTAMISESTSVNFVVVDFDAGELDCTVFETVPAGYTPSYQAAGPGAVDDDVSGCHFFDVGRDAGNTCAIVNTVNPVNVEITKQWVIEQAGGDFTATDFKLTLWCDAPIDGADPVCPAEAPAAPAPSSWCLSFSGSGNQTFTAAVTPSYPASTCRVTEQVMDAAVEVDNGCDNLVIRAGQGADCVVTNTVFFEGIPSLNRGGMLALMLLLLGIGGLAVRRLY